MDEVLNNPSDLKTVKTVKMKLGFFGLFCLISISIHAQTTLSGSFDHGGITRNYSYYVPASYTPGSPVPLVIGLHGTGSSGAEFAQYRDFKPIADTANFIVVTPDGSTLFGLTFWNYDNIFGSTVDDVGFLETLIDTISANYSINQERIYATGMSNGSFMCYALACQSNRFAAIATVAGSMSVNMYNSCVPNHPIPALHIHGTDDGINPYEGTSTMAEIDLMNRFWVDQNQCDTVPTIFSIPDIVTSDGATCTRFLYEGGINGHTVELFKVNGGGHSWPGGPIPGSSEVTCMDLFASSEIWRFFSQYERYMTSSLDEIYSSNVTIWPNPTNDILHFEYNLEDPISHVELIDVLGNVVFEKTDKIDPIQQLDLHQVAAGSYLLKMTGATFHVTKKIIVSEGN